MIDAIPSILTAYQQRWQAHYSHPCSLAVSPVQYMKLGQHLQILTPEQLETGLDGYFSAADTYVQLKRHPLGLWLTAPMQWAKLEPVAKACPRCGRVPVCTSTTACTARILAEAQR